MRSEVSHPTYVELRRRFSEGDLRTKRRMLVDGAAFASFSIMTPIEDAESTMRRWLVAGRPTDLRLISRQLRETREHRLRAVAALDPWRIVALANSFSPFAEQAFAEWTWGYGPAKASFALALAGLGTLACLDRRIIRKHALDPEVLHRWPDYLAAVARVYPGERDSASAQAVEWFRDLASERFDTAHDVMLGIPHPQTGFGWA